MRSALIVLAILVTSCGSRSADNPATPPPNSTAAEAGGVETSNVAEHALVPAPSSPNDGKTAETDSPCLVQGTKALSVPPIRATGTEPFWSAQVQGRCVTYSTPENQDGVRVWTQYSAQPSNGRRWLGRLNGKTFEMRVRPEAGCSDGMSNMAYPFAVDLSVDGELRKGCARPL